ncbi:MAG: SHOCT domain-containing protein [Candidatus Neomarinimicrobiota bacterium]
MKTKILIIMLLVLTVGCGSFNEGQAELHINKNISTGQELLDLQEALDKDIISKEEFEEQRTKILEGNQSFEIDIEEDIDDGSENVKIRINVNGKDVISIDSEEE